MRVTVPVMAFVTTRGGVSVLMATGDHTARNVSVLCYTTSNCKGRKDENRHH